MSDKEEKLAGTSIQWYPGHMAKARREIEEAMKKVDVVVEIIDARIPVASRNPVLDQLIGNKPRIVVLNKSDLADEEKNKIWLEVFNKQFDFYDKGVLLELDEQNNDKETVNTDAIIEAGKAVIPDANKYEDLKQCGVIVDSNTGKGINDFKKLVIEMFKEKLDKAKEKGLIGASIKAMVVGIPNVGKSTFINKIAGKQTAETGNKPGVTKKNQWIRLDDKIQLLDTPGVLWPKLENQDLAMHLAYVGTIKDEILDVDTLAVNLLRELVEKGYKKQICERYRIAEDVQYEMDYELLEEIGRKRGCLVKGGEVDFTKASNIVLDEFRRGIIGRITLE